jgi:glycosyltransferase involved in cell wall biosynthesis
VTKEVDISVIVPVYNKAEVLRETLLALKCQTIGEDAFEVLVVDDGSTDHTQELVAEISVPYTLSFVRQENMGAGPARNLGVGLAKGTLCLFLDADIILDSKALAAHLTIHREHDRVLVSSRILPRMPNPVGMEDLIFQKSFDLGRQPRSLPWHCTITQALSIKRTHFRQVGEFVPDLPRGQDIEFGYRAALADFQIFYCPEAIGWHNHALTLKQRCVVERRNHERLVRFYQMYPHLANEMDYLRYKWPVDWRASGPRANLPRLVRHVFAWGPILFAMESAWRLLARFPLPEPLRESLYWRIVGSYQLKGLRDGINKWGPIGLTRQQN